MWSVMITRQYAATFPISSLTFSQWYALMLNYAELSGVCCGF